MMGIETIRRLSNVAAYRAAEEGRYPLTTTDPEDIHNLPFLGDYTPPGWRRALWSEVDEAPRNVWSPRPDEEVTFMVDSSGFGAPDEPALTFDEFADYALRRFAWAIRETGQFQIVVGAYVRSPGSPGNPAPDEESVTCEECGTVHNDFEECDEDGLQSNCEHAHVRDEEVYPEGIYFGARVQRVTECDDCNARLIPSEPDEDGRVTWEIER
jgi:hypothetical protein